jgi:hypothetical protein
MNDPCPNPVDWLHALEAGALPAALRTHLSACPSCREVTRRLEPVLGATSVPDFSLPARPRTDGRWSERAVIDPPRGTFCVTSGAFDQHGCSYSGLDRLLVLTLTEPEEEFGSRWIEAVPVDTEVEASGPVDGLFRPVDSTLDIPLRLRFGLQVRLSVDQLASEVGRLSDSATSQLTRLVAGDMEAIAFGTAYEHAFDWRRRVDPEAEDVVATLSGAYDAALENSAPARIQELGERLRSAARSLVPIHHFGVPSVGPAFAAAGDIVLVDPSPQPLRVELFAKGEPEPAAVLRIYRHDGWFQAEHVSGRRVVWSASGEDVADCAIEDPAIHSLEDFVPLISVEQSDAR